MGEYFWMKGCCLRWQIEVYKNLPTSNYIIYIIFAQGRGERRETEQATKLSPTRLPFPGQFGILIWIAIVIFTQKKPYPGLASNFSHYRWWGSISLSFKTPLVRSHLSLFNISQSRCSHQNKMELTAHDSKKSTMTKRSMIAVITT